MTAILAHITLESGKNPQYCTIWLHGLGADGHDFVPVAEALNLPVAMRYVFPHAPHRPVSINGGFPMRAWYDISETDLSSDFSASARIRQDEAGIRDSHASIEAVIDAQIANGISAQHIFLAGFSQGGAIALHTALRSTRPLAGVLALSTYLPLADSAQAEATSCSRNTPIFIAHGSLDAIVPIEMGSASRDALQALGYGIEWHEYPMQHTVTDRELRDIEAWLENRIRRLETDGMQQS